MAEKESDEALTMAEKGSDRNVTNTRADIMSQTEKGANDEQLLKKLAGCMRSVQAKFRANEEQAKLPWLRGLIL